MGQAASLSVDPAHSVLGRGDAVLYSVRIDTDEAAGECFNAVSGVLQFSGPITPIDVSLGNSIFGLWIESPTISSDARSVSFAGGIPNGYCGRIAGDPRLTNTLFQVIVRTDTPAETNEEIGTISFTPDTVALLNDGTGQNADLDTLSATVRIGSSTNEFVTDAWSGRVAADTQDPRPFSITLTSDETTFDGRYYISFNTTDKQTGIDRYEVMEEPLDQFGSFLWGRADAPWVAARSPYVLEDQTLNSVIRVRAIDKAGNEYVASLLPEESMRLMSDQQFLLYLGMGIVAFLLLLVAITLIVRRPRPATQIAHGTHKTHETKNDGFKSDTADSVYPDGHQSPAQPGSSENDHNTDPTSQSPKSHE
jgi:Na+-transporting methylmalonyl-CoA/oxaloacetate decarboxylase gamma subunit